MVNQQYAPMFEVLNALAVTPIERTRILECAVAAAIGRSLPMPSNPVEVPSDYFVSNHAMSIGKLISDINEMSLINVRQVRDNVRDHWMVRYHTLHDAQVPAGSEIFDFFCGISRVGLYFTKEEYDFMSLHANSIYRCMNKFKECFAQAGC